MNNYVKLAKAPNILYTISRLPSQHSDGLLSYTCILAYDV